MPRRPSSKYTDDYDDGYDDYDPADYEDPVGGGGGVPEDAPPGYVPCASIQAGWQVAARFSEDNFWYPATVDQVRAGAPRAGGGHMLLRMRCLWW